jgi:hypothetical protein
MAYDFNYIAITNSVEDSLVLDACGIQQIMVDTETLGKAERQTGINAVFNSHSIEDVTLLKESGVHAKLICRINPFNCNTYDEIDSAIASGTDFIMLPMIQSLEELKLMVKRIQNKTSIIPLIETSYSIFKLKEIIEITKAKQIHFGLNDLSISLGMKNLFEVLVSPIFAKVIEFANEHVELVGVGGIGDPLVRQKLSPELLINEHNLLGSRSVILSRSFFSKGYNQDRILSSLEAIEILVKKDVDKLLHNELIQQIEKF